MSTVLAAPGEALLGEAPRWTTLIGPIPALHFSDLLTGDVFALAGGAAERVLGFPGETVSAIIPLTTGTTAIALHRAIVEVDSAGAIIRRIELDLPQGTRLSDSTAGPSGHIWLGVVPAGDEPHPGMLVRLETEGFSIQRSGVGFSNGLGFTADGTALLHIDSSTNTVWRIDHDPATGDLGSALELFHLPAEAGTLDGLCLDDQDRAWMAVFGGGVIVGVDADGTEVARLGIPAPRVSSCVFGPDRVLYVTTARIDAPDTELSEYPLAGSLFQIEMGCLGGPVWKGRLPSLSTQD